MNENTNNAQATERILTESDLAALRLAVKPYYTEKRYAHALSVESEAAWLGEFFLPEKVLSLRAAALLHDITKKYDFQKQLQCCRQFGIILQEPISHAVLHQMTGAAVAGADFSAYTDEEILGGIRWHATGRWGMTVFESIVFLADYIEPTRSYAPCISIRKSLHEGLEHTTDPNERLHLLNESVLAALDNTLSYLLERRFVIHMDTISARNYYLLLSENFTR